VRAKIISVVANNFYVHLYDLKIQIKAIPKGIFKHNSHELKPMVGDDVEVELIGNTYLITKIYERYNQLIRPKVANIDIVLIVVSIVQPDLNTLSLNKYLAFYEARNIKNVLIGLSKYDLANNHLKQKINKLILDYKKNNYAVLDGLISNRKYLFKELIIGSQSDLNLTNAQTKITTNNELSFTTAPKPVEIKSVLIDTKFDNHPSSLINLKFNDSENNLKENDILLLKEKIKSKTLCLAGNSGVGKSTLINKLDPSIQQRTQEISHFLNRGKHTTTSTKLISFANGFLVDTPGFGNLEVNLTKNEMANAFNDFANYARFCKFSNCLHIEEPECAIKKAVDEKLIVN